MRGVFIIFILVSVLLLSSCDVTPEPDYIDVSEFSRVKMIDFPYEPPDAQEVESIYELYKNENKAISMYRKTLDLFPKEHPFATIIITQELQLKLLEEIYAKYELNIPEENWYPLVTEFEDPEQACAAAIIFGENSIALYDDWLEQKGFTTKVDNQDLRFLYEKIRNDYERSLIPAFKRCARHLG